MILDPWQRLGIAATSDTSAIRKAYATLIRTYRPDTHPTEFSQIREAYEQALQLALFMEMQFEGESLPQVKVDKPSEVAREPFSLIIPSVEALKECYETQGEEAAALHLDVQLDALEITSLDVRMGFESSLIAWLDLQEYPPVLVCALAARRFGWLLDTNQVRRHGVSEHVLSAAYYGYEYHELDLSTNDSWGPTQAEKLKLLALQRANKQYWKKIESILDGTASREPISKSSLTKKIILGCFKMPIRFVLWMAKNHPLILTLIVIFSLLRVAGLIFEYNNEPYREKRNRVTQQVHYAVEQAMKEPLSWPNCDLLRDLSSPIVSYGLPLEWLGEQYMTRMHQCYESFGPSVMSSSMRSLLDRQHQVRKLMFSKSR